MAEQKCENKVLLSVIGTIQGNYNENSNCACCDGKHRFSTSQNWEWGESFLNYMSPYKDVNSAIEKVIRRLPDGSKLKLTIELLTIHQESK